MFNKLILNNKNNENYSKKYSNNIVNVDTNKILETETDVYKEKIHNNICIINNNHIGSLDKMLSIKINKNTIRNKKIKRNKYKLSSQIFEKERKKYWIYIDSKLYFFINFVFSISILYIIIIYPFEIAFLLNEKMMTIIILNNIIDIIFILDFLQNFFITYIDKNYKLIDDLKKIFFNYLLGWFIIDLWSAIPFNIINLFIKNDPNYKYTRFFKLLKIFKIFRLANFLRKFRFLKKEEKNNNKRYQINPAIERLLLSLFVVIILFNLLACLWYISATWYDDKNNWVLNLNFNNSSNFEKYWVSLYWVSQTIFSVGYGDFPANNILERILALISMIIGVFIYSLVVGSFSSLFNSLNIHLKKKNNSLSIINSISKKYKIPNSLEKEIKFVIQNNL